MRHRINRWTQPRTIDHDPWCGAPLTEESTPDPEAVTCTDCLQIMKAYPDGIDEPIPFPLVTR